MYLYKKEGSANYWFSFTHNKRRYQESTRLENRKDAEDYASAFRTRVVKGDVGLTPKQLFTIDELLDRLVQRWELKGKDSVQNLNLIKHTRKAFANRMAHELTTQDVERFAIRRRKAGYANASTNRIIQCVRRAYNLARTPFPEFELLDEKDNVRQGTFSPKEMRTLLSNLPDDGLRDYVDWSYNTGMRKGEVAALRWAYVHGDAIIVPAGVCKNRKPHRVPVAGPLMEILKRRKSAQSFKVDGVTRLSEYIFHRGDGMQIIEFKKSWARAICAAGLGKRVCPKCSAEGISTRCGNCKPKTKTRFVGRLFHDLRRTFITDATAAGTPQSVCMSISGHRTVSTWLRYAISTDDAKSEAFEKTAHYRAG
jgi:integrase